MAVNETHKVNGFAFEVTNGKFKTLFGVPENIGGNDLAPTPHQYLESALAACTAITVSMYAKRKEIPLDDINVTIKITKEGAQNEIQRQIQFIGNLSIEDKQKLLEIADKCPIHKLLSRGALIQTLHKS